MTASTAVDGGTMPHAPRFGEVSSHTDAAEYSNSAGATGIFTYLFLSQMFAENWSIKWSFDLFEDVCASSLIRDSFRPNKWLVLISAWINKAQNHLSGFSTKKSWFKQIIDASAPAIEVIHPFLRSRSPRDPAERAIPFEMNQAV